jgi:TolA-binding protein
MRRSLFFLVAGGMITMLCSGAFALSREALAEMSSGDLLAGATQVLSEANYSQAIPYLTEYLERMKDAEEDQVLALMQEVRLKLGKIYAYHEDPLPAAKYLKQYTEKLPLYKPREAYKLLAVNLHKSGQNEECIAAVTQALTRPLPKPLPGKEKKVDYDQLSRDQLAGLSARQLRRYERFEEEAAGDLASGFSEKAPDPEPDYTLDELVLLNMTLAEACTALERWEACLEPYRFVIDNTVDDSHRGYAILQTVNALTALERFEEAGRFVIQLSRSNARYDIRVNMALMKAAEALSGAGELDSALMIYRMVLPREEIVAYQKIRMNELRRDAGLPDVDLQIVTNAAGRVEVRFGNKKPDYFEEADSSQEAAAALPAKPMQLVRLEELVSTLVALPPYENEVLYRAGVLYADAGRPWEAVSALETVAERDPDGELGLRAFAESLQVLVDPLQEYERVERVATEFLAVHQEGLAPRMVAFALTGCYQKQERWKDLKGLLPVIEGFVPDEDETIRRYECELYYMQAIADLMLFNYEQALIGFENLQIDFPNSHQQENAKYWHGMSQLFLKQYEQALAELELYCDEYPTGKWIAEALFHRGICLFSLEQTDASQGLFAEVIRDYPDSSVYSDACSMRGDILASKGLLDEAQADYEEAIASARSVRQDTYAVFQMVAMFELERRHDEMIHIVQAYLDRRGAEADVAKAVYWIGKIRLAQGRVDEAVAAYRDAILQYGGNVQQAGVDLIISELVKVSRRLKEDSLLQFRESLQADLDAAENETLRLRLRALRAKIDRTELELGRKLIAEQSDLTQAPPPVLSVICQASFAEGDYSRAEDILDIFRNHFEESEFMNDALKLRTVDLFLSGDLDGAMRIVEDAQGRYGTQSDAAWAQLMKGRIEFRRGHFEAARRIFRDLLNTREWRGEPYAEATYRLGEIEEAAGDLTTAFAWYQRVYMQHKGYAGGKWAAEGYLASARCLKKLGLENDRRNTYRAMLFDRYVNHLPQVEEAKAVLGEAEVLEIKTFIEQGIHSNVVVTVDSDGAE